MNEVDKVGTEGTETNTSTNNGIDQINQSRPKQNLNPKLIERYGGVVIKGFKSASNMDDVLSILKEAGLSPDYALEDLQVTDKGQQKTINIHDLQPAMCVKLSKNLHGKIKQDKTISVYPLVEDTPLKTLSSKLESLIENSAEEDSEEQAINQALQKSKATDNRKSLDQNALKTGAKKLWADDLDISDDSENDDKGKRKAGGSPELDFEKPLTKREKKKLRQILNKSR